MKQLDKSVSLLTPVPMEHLRSGIDNITTAGKVAFGSMNFGVFRKLDELRSGDDALVLIYASDSVEMGLGAVVSWVGRYTSHVESRRGAHPHGKMFRPETTFKYPDDNKGWWAVFYELVELYELGEDLRIKIKDLQSLDKNKPYGKPFIPEGPIIVQRPSIVLPIT